MNSEVLAEVLSALNDMRIEYRLIDHPPVMTMAECAEIEKGLGALMPKNLFLTPRNKSRVYLCLTHPGAQFRTADISRQIGSSRLSFADEDMLIKHMRTKPGAISPMGLIFDAGQEVGLLVDRSLMAAPRLGFHPCVNTASLAMRADDFFDIFLPRTGHAPEWVSFDGHESE